MAEKSNIDRSFEQQDLCHEIAELVSGIRHLQYDVHQVVVNPETKEEWNAKINDVQRKILELQNSIEELKKVSSCKYSY
jgi:predicted  nucleic acid-binding Zn-ribbon protein